MCVSIVRLEKIKRGMIRAHVPLKRYLEPD